MVIGNLPHVKYVATLDLHVPRLPCNLSLMVCFGDINVSQSSVATYARYGWIFNTSLTTNLPRNLSVTYCLNRLRFDLAPLFRPLHPVDFTANLLENLPVKKIDNRFRFDRIIVMSSGVSFSRPTL